MSIVTDLKKLANPKQAKNLARFFKTGKGEYGEGDLFLGISVPKQRQIAKKYNGLTFPKLTKLLHSPIHEYRLVSLLILVEQFKKANPLEQKKIFDYYLKNTKFINNWDLVDLSAPKIIGAYLLDKPMQRTVLYQLAKSTDLWKKRISVLATFMFIKYQQFSDTLKISQILLTDKHDLIHKAVGWALREVGKKNLAVEEIFLQKYCLKMSRTMLRYSIEKFPEKKRRFYLNLR